MIIYTKKSKYANPANKKTADTAAHFRRRHEAEDLYFKKTPKPLAKNSKVSYIMFPYHKNLFREEL